MKLTKKNFSVNYFVIGAVIGAVLFVCIYGFRVLDFTYDEWLLTGNEKDTSQSTKYLAFIKSGDQDRCHSAVQNKDWKRTLIVFGSFGVSSFLVFFVIGGLTDVLASGSNGFGIYSANHL